MPLTSGDWLSLRGSKNWHLMGTTFSVKEAKISEEFVPHDGSRGWTKVLDLMAADLIIVKSGFGSNNVRREGR